MRSRLFALITALPLTLLVYAQPSDILEPMDVFNLEYASDPQISPDGKKVIRDDLISQDEFRDLMKVDDWNDVVIIAKGNHIRHYLNGRLVMDFKDNHPELAIREGILAVQLHAGKPMWTEFKNIRICSLD